jgi:hypothetical protein
MADREQAAHGPPAASATPDPTRAPDPADLALPPPPAAAAAAPPGDSAPPPPPAAAAAAPPGDSAPPPNAFLSLFNPNMDQVLRILIGCLDATDVVRLCCTCNSFWVQRIYLYRIARPSLSLAMLTATRDDVPQMLATGLSRAMVLLGDESLLDRACEVGNLKLVQFLIRTHDLRPEDCTDVVFTACANDHLDVLWELMVLIDSSLVSLDSRTDMFLTACRETPVGSRVTRRLLRGLVRGQHQRLLEEAVPLLCQRGDLTVLRALCARMGFCTEHLRSLPGPAFEVFELALYGGHTDVCEYLLYGGLVPIEELKYPAPPSGQLGPVEFLRAVEWCARHFGLAPSEGRGGPRLPPIFVTESWTTMNLPVIKRVAELVDFGFVWWGFDHLCAMACEQGELDVAEWALTHYSLSEDVNWNALRGALTANHLPLAIWACETFRHTRESVLDFHEAVNDEDREDWGHEFRQEDDPAYRPPMLTAALQSGETDGARYLTEQFGLTRGDARRDDYSALVTACERCQVAGVQWLVGAYGFTDRDIEESWALWRAVKAENVPLVRWLVRRFGLTKRDLTVWAYDGGHGGVPWPMSCLSVREYRAPSRDVTLFDALFDWTTNAMGGRSRLEMAQELVNLFDIHRSDVLGGARSFLCWACGESIPALEWLRDEFGLNRDDLFEGYDWGSPHIRSAVGLGRLQTLQWLHRHFHFTPGEMHEAIIGEEYYLWTYDEDGKLQRGGYCPRHLGTLQWVADTFGLDIALLQNGRPT